MNENGFFTNNMTIFEVQENMTLNYTLSVMNISKLIWAALSCVPVA